MGLLNWLLGDNKAQSDYQELLIAKGVRDDVDKEYQKLAKTRRWSARQKAASRYDDAADWASDVAGLFDDEVR